MATARAVTSGTEEHEGPLRSAVRRTRDALVVAFPEPRVLPVPIAGEPVGREWLQRGGIVDSKISTNHVIFSRPGGGLFLEDARSRNGTWVNGARLRPGERVPVSDGDILRVGKTLLVYRDDFVGDDAPSPPLGRLVGPYGLRAATAALTSIASRRPSNVLIEGETGTGKELVAQALAEAVGRAGTYGIVNIAGIAAGVFESQVFGYVPGAYSGSGKGSPGVFVAHDGGTVFLDEIGELPLDLQAKLLRVLDNREVMPVGAVRATKVDVLVISATNRVLEDAVEAGTFRRDLFARLSAARVDLPPLRERAEDIWEIARALARTRGEALDSNAAEVEAVERLLLHPWKSNVRELATALERVAGIEAPPALRLEVVERVLGARDASRERSRTGLTMAEVQQALERCGGNESAAAKDLGISRGKLRRLLDANRPG
jgi:transcriptional regulator with AAA-type ATPase domain